MEENDLSRHPIRETYLVRSIVDSFEAVDLVRRRCRSFSTTSSMCLFNSTNFGSRSSRGLPICFFSIKIFKKIFCFHSIYLIQIYSNFVLMIRLVDYYLLMRKVFVNEVIIVIVVDFLYHTNKRIQIQILSFYNQSTRWYCTNLV